MILDALQQQAINWKDGPCAVIAGPGSGKTAVITHRANALIAEKKLSPGNLLTITFTKAAAYEMQSRFLKLTSGRFQEAVFGTFHAVFYRILAGSAYEGPVRFITTREKRAMMENVLRERSLRFSLEITETLLRAVSKEKNRGTYLFGETPCASFDTPFASRFAELFFAYEEIRQSLGKMDYDDIAPACLQLLMSNNVLLDKWQKRFTHIQIDEFQDVNPVQYALVKLLAKGQENLFVVGDDDQSIYGFRGASPDVMKQFFRDFPQAGQIRLTTNYRSNREVVRASSRMIAHSRYRIQKTSRPQAQAEDGLFDMTTYPDREEELSALTCRIEDVLFKIGGNRDACAVLYRSGNDALRIAGALKQKNIPYQMTEKITPPFTEAAAEDVLAYLRFAVCGAGRSDFLRILNKPVRFLPRACAEREAVTEEDVLAYCRGNEIQEKEVRRLFRDVAMLSRLKPHLAIGYILQAVGYGRFLQKETDAAGYAKAYDAVSRLQDLAKTFPDTASFLRHIADLREAADTYAGTVSSGKEGVRLMTMHAAKGLEFDTVFLPFLNEGTLPQVKAVTEEETEEERRILYVAMTRAKSRLHLSYAEKDGTRKLQPSRFLNF